MSRNLYKNAFTAETTLVTVGDDIMKRTACALTMILLFLAIEGIQFVKPVMAKTMTVLDDYPTIQSAIDAADEGDRVFVKSGYYTETLVINKSISLVGEDREHTVIDAQRNLTVVQITESGVTFTNFTLGNSYKPEGYGRYAIVIGIN